MKPVFGFLISTDNRYNNVVDVDGKDLIVNTEITERDYEFVNRIGTVIETPRWYDGEIKQGDEVIVHHNVFRRWFDVRGNERNSGNYVDENLYICNADQIFGYKSGDWRACDGYCFVVPVPEDDLWETRDEKPHYGVLKYKGDDLDIPVGSLVGFTPNSEYEFMIEGEKTYRILSHQIAWTSRNKENKS